MIKKKTKQKKNLFHDDKNFKKSSLGIISPPVLESLPVAKKAKTLFYKRLQWRFLITQHIDKALRRGVADFLKCDWLAFLR